MRVLLADFDSARAKRHSEACVARGYVVDGARHGASALELALERVPDVVVCPVDLPVIDGERLAGILRGNPRTRHASFVFLVKDELDAPMAIDPRDGTVVEPWHDEDVLDHIDALIERTSRYGEARGDTEIEGKLTQISLVDLLQIFQMNKRSGTLRIWRSDGVGSGSILVRSGHVLDASVPLADGTCIVGEKAVYRLLAWKEGRFEFAPGSVSEAKRVEKPTRGLLLEAMRQMDEWETLRSELPAADARVALQVPPERVPGIEQPLTAEVVQAVETYRRVGEVVDHCSFPDYQVLRVVHELLGQGSLAIELQSDGRDGTPRAVEGVFAQAQLQRLHDWAQEQHPRSGSVLKLLVVAASPEELRAFHGALREHPDFMSDGRLVRDPDRIGGLGTLGHFALGEGLTLRLVAVPAAPAYAPLWQAAAHGMLGAVLLCSKPLGEALEALRGVRERLCAARGQALVHLVLGDDPGGKLREDAGQRFPELDLEALFALPASQGMHRQEALRQVFARLVP